MHAVVVIGGKQYIVQKGDRLTVERFDGEVGKTAVFERVLLTTDGKKTAIGMPTVDGQRVTAKILSHNKGDKIDIYRFKSKVRYRKHIGFRPAQTTLEIISVGK